MSHFNQGHCPLCDKKVLAVKAPVNHILHALISFVTLGLWIIPWLLVVFVRDMSPWRCQGCGSEVIK